MIKTEIYTSKKKAIRLLVISLLFVAISLCFIMNPKVFINPFLQTPYLIQGIGLLSVLLFGFGMYVATRRIVKAELALVVDDEGIHMHPQKTNNKIIDWGCIMGFSEIKINSQKILIIRVSNPEYWLLQESNMINKKMMQYNFANYGSPLSISTGSLAISQENLMYVLEDGFKKKKTNTTSSEGKFFISETILTKK
ncbi:STM3941 family protein [Aquimarina sp. AU119]|uniref:STM3941 family protein n=1 Tax=Aquimarina sp. AU119 TaxID=2108528 RepID=UPI000D69CD98|nr:STM3941 family protein [Aquimarina sp. AU119]